MSSPDRVIRNQRSTRPTISSLLYGKRATVLDADDLGARIGKKPEEDAAEPTEEAPVDSDELRRFGQYDGVFSRCLVNIFGVIMFLRLGFIFAIGGIGYAVLVVITSTVVTGITTLSLSAICTNGDVQGKQLFEEATLISYRWWCIFHDFSCSWAEIWWYYWCLIFSGQCSRYRGGQRFSRPTPSHLSQIYVVGFAEAIVSQIDRGSELIFGIACIVFVLIQVLIGVDWVVKVLHMTHRQASTDSLA